MSSSSDPSSLDLSMGSVEAMVGDAMSQCSGSQSSSNTTKKGLVESSGKHTISQVTKSLPKPPEHDKSVAVVPASCAPSPASQSSLSCPRRIAHGESSKWSVLFGSEHH